VDGLRAQLAAAAAGVSAADGREAELRFLQRQFEEVTQELAQQQEQVRGYVCVCVGGGGAADKCSVWSGLHANAAT
jgi:hypothetical protein